MAISKVEFAGTTLIDLTADTVTPETLVEGVTAHDASGQQIVGVRSSTTETWVFTLEDDTTVTKTVVVE